MMRVVFGAMAVAAALGAAALAAGGPPEREIIVIAQKFDFTPETIVVKKGEPVVLDITSLDRAHGFKVPELGLHADIQPDRSVRVRFVPDKVGRFSFACDNFCGDGHEDMNGVIVVEE
jgi:cytochrome c oxidase subunit II